MEKSVSHVPLWLLYIIVDISILGNWYLMCSCVYISIIVDPYDNIVVWVLVLHEFIGQKNFVMYHNGSYY